MRLPGVLLGFVLCLLLASTTPVGTGGGAHQFDLLHPLFSHLHLVNGRLLTHEQMAQQAQRATAQPATPGPSFGSGSGGNAANAGLGLSPTLSSFRFVLPWQVARQKLISELAPAGREEAPPNRPPVTFSTSTSTSTH